MLVRCALWLYAAAAVAAAPRVYVLGDALAANSSAPRVYTAPFLANSGVPCAERPTEYLAQYFAVPAGADVVSVQVSVCDALELSGLVAGLDWILADLSDPASKVALAVNLTSGLPGEALVSSRVAQLVGSTAVVSTLEGYWTGGLPAGVLVVPWADRIQPPLPALPPPAPLEPPSPVPTCPATQPCPPPIGSRLPWKLVSLSLAAIFGVAVLVCCVLGVLAVLRAFLGRNRPDREEYDTQASRYALSIDPSRQTSRMSEAQIHDHPQRQLSRTPPSRPASHHTFPFDRAPAQPYHSYPTHLPATPFSSLPTDTQLSTEPALAFSFDRSFVRTLRTAQSCQAPVSSQKVNQLRRHSADLTSIIEGTSPIGTSNASPIGTRNATPIGTSFTENVLIAPESFGRH